MNPASIAPPPAPHAARPLYLTDAQQTDIYHQSRNHAVSFLQNSLSDLHEWEFISEKKSVQFYRKKSNDGTTYTINGITRIVADLDETMRTLYCEDTTALSDLFSQLHDDAFADGAVLAALPAKRDPSGICREQCSIKTLSFRPFNAMDKARQYTVVDYCTIRTGKADEGSNGDTADNRLGIQLMYSTETVDPAGGSSRRLASSSSLATATSSMDESSASQLLPSGFIVYPTAKKGVLEVIFSWSAHDPRGISRGYKKSILSLVASVARLENIFLALRIAAAGFIKSKNWVSDKERSYCFICRESFGAFRRRHHCRLCGDITCSKCGTLTAVKLPVVGLCQVRICMRCLKENDSSRINVSLPPSASTANPATTAQPRSAHRSSDGSQLQVMERLSHGMSNLSAVPTQHQIDSDEDDEEVYGSMQSSVLGGSSSMDSSNSSSVASSSYMGSYQNNMSSSSRLASNGVIDEAEEVQYHRGRGSYERPPRDADGAGFTPLTTLSASTQLTQVKQFSYPLHYTDGQLWPLAPIPTEEAARLRKLDDLSILDTPQEQEYNHIAQSAAEALQASFGFVSFIDAKREWVKASYGNGAGANTSVARDVSISAHVIMSYEVTVVPNLTTDVRFRDNPLVVDGIKLRSFVGYPVVTSDGFIVGVLGVADTRPRDNVTVRQVAQLKQLATHVSRVLEERSGYQPSGLHHHHAYNPPQAHSQTYNMPTAQSTIHNTLLDLLKKTEATGKTLQQTQQSMLNAGRHVQS